MLLTVNTDFHLERALSINSKFHKSSSITVELSKFLQSMILVFIHIFCPFLHPLGPRTHLKIHGYDFTEVVTFPYFSIRWFVISPLLPIRQQTVDLGNFERLVSAVRSWHVDFLVAPLQLISSMSKHNCPCLNIATIQNLHSSHSQKIICRYYKHVLMLPKFGDQNLLDKLTVCNFVEILDVWVSCLTMIQILKIMISEQKSSSEWTVANM